MQVLKYIVCLQSKYKIKSWTMEKENEKITKLDFKAQYTAMEEPERVSFRKKFLNLTQIAYSSFYYKMANMDSLTYRDKKDIAEILEQPIEQLFPDLTI